MIGVEYFGVMLPIIGIVCITIVSLKKLEMKKSKHGDQQSMDELYYSIKDMNKRISNLETILFDLEKRS